MVWPTVFSKGVVERKRYGGLPAILQQPHVFLVEEFWVHVLLIFELLQELDENFGVFGIETNRLLRKLLLLSQPCGARHWGRGVGVRGKG